MNRPGNYIMNIKSIGISLSAGTALGILAGGINSGRAASVTVVPNADYNISTASAFQSVRWEEAKIEKLRHAYRLLELAKSDYNGHRVEAMHSIKKAAEVLGVELKGWKEHAEESQWESDRRVSEARRILESLQDETRGREQEHVHKAVKELEKAGIAR
jgi:uncharacterized protein YaiE (UPF0345 family)